MGQTRNGWKATAAIAAVVGTILVMTPRGVAAQVVVRIYDNFDVAPQDLVVARTGAETILRDAGIEVRWVDCWSRRSGGASASPVCKQPLGPTDIVLRLQAGEISHEKFVSMGFSLIGAGPDRPFLSTVFPDVVASVSRGAGADARFVLGLAIAHEIGHLLLNTNAHARAGLMRAGWSRAELRRSAVTDWRFLGEEKAAMHTRVSLRATDGN